MPAESGVDRHNQNQIDFIQNVFNHGFGRGRIQRDPRFDAERFNQLNQAVKVFVGFGVDGNQIRARFDKVGNECGNGLNHQMNVKHFFRGGANGFDNGRAERDVGNEMAVHDVDMDVIGTRVVNGGYFRPQFGKIGGKDAWGDFDGHDNFLETDVFSTMPCFFAKKKQRITRRR